MKLIEPPKVWNPPLTDKMIIDAYHMHVEKYMYLFANENINLVFCDIWRNQHSNELSKRRL